MGAAYVVTGSVNQACYEAGASEHTRRLLAQAEMADVTMAPAADMLRWVFSYRCLSGEPCFGDSKLYEFTVDMILLTKSLKNAIRLRSRCFVNRLLKFGSRPSFLSGT